MVGQDQILQLHSCYCILRCHAQSQIVDLQLLYLEFALQRADHSVILNVASFFVVNFVGVISAVSPLIILYLFDSSD